MRTHEKLLEDSALYRYRSDMRTSYPPREEDASAGVKAADAATAARCKAAQAAQAAAVALRAGAAAGQWWGWWGFKPSRRALPPVP